DMEKMGLEFLKWSVEFLYGDFIALPLKLRISEGKRLCRAWTDCGCIRRKAELPAGAAERADYFFNVSRRNAEEPLLSIVIVLDRDNADLTKTLSAWLEQDTEDIELLLVNNTKSALIDDVIYKYLLRDYRIRIIYAPNDDMITVRNKALRMCAGEYIHFAEPGMPLVNIPQSICGGVYDVISAENSTELSELYLKRDFLECNNIKFGDYSIESEAVVAEEIFLAEPRISYSGGTIAHNSRRYIGGLRAGDCVKILKSFAYRLELAAKYNNAELHNKIFSALSDDFYMGMILSFVYPDNEGRAELPVEIITALLELTELFSPDMLPPEERRPLPLIYVRLTDRLHKKIADISDIYQII
ncbi:MAG: glycosyltransferase, partial [Oscillospiraceae bacterium]|nr:glycosyltransferase [Oscillospiraceae bacterium]